jgi:hypothetical protein
MDLIAHAEALQAEAHDLFGELDLEQAFPSFGPPLKVELTVWLHAVERPHVADALRVAGATVEEKEAILRLKSTYPGYPEVVGGSDIYPAVLEHGVRSTGELAAYLGN